jgi:hypothetical protein
MTQAFSPIAAAIAELLATPAVSTITTRIRPIEPAAGDALGPGSYIPFVVVSILDQPWQAPTATSSVSLGLRCYAADFAKAEALYLACAAVFHRKGPRIATSRLGIYNSLAQGGGTPDKDPDTKQPLFWGIVELNVSIQAIPA